MKTKVRDAGYAKERAALWRRSKWFGFAYFAVNIVMLVMELTVLSKAWPMAFVNGPMAGLALYMASDCRYRERCFSEGYWP